MKIRLFVAALAIFPSLCFAQQPDRKDFMVEMLQRQRNAAADKEVVCFGDAGIAIADVSKKAATAEARVAELEAEVTALKAAKRRHR